MHCTKEELDKHLKEVYHDPKRAEALPIMPNLLHPTRPGVKFNMGDTTYAEVTSFVKKARAKSATGGNVVSKTDYTSQLKKKRLPKYYRR